MLSPTPLATPTLSPTPIAKTYPNNSDTSGDFHWWNNGKYDVRAERKSGKIVPGEQTFSKMYYACSQKKPTGCKATKTVHFLPAGESVQFKEVHNHPSSSKPKIDPEIKQTILSQLNVGGRPSVIHAKLVNDTQHPITSKTVPTKQNIYNWQRKITTAQLPTGIFVFSRVLLFTYLSILSPPFHPFPIILISLSLFFLSLHFFSLSFFTYACALTYL
jgi:hypothetical protein